MRSLRFQSLVLILTGMVLVVTLGWFCLTFSFAKGLERASYDLPFPWRANIATPEVCLVSMDEKSARALGQPTDAPWDRRLHARLLKSLKEQGARAVLFDLVFDVPNADAGADQELAAAIRENGRVYLGAGMQRSPGREVLEDRVLPPIPLLRRAAAGWGLLELRPIDPDEGVRRIFPGTEEVPAATWRLARALGAALPETAGPGEPERWLNYYAPRRHWATAGYEQALKPAELAPGFFRDRVVIVGGQMELGSLSQAKDEFRTPYTGAGWGDSFAAGMEIHATTLLNLLRGEWLTRMAPRTEHGLIALLGAGIAALLGVICAFCPFRTAATAGVVMLLIAAAACWGAWHERVWFSWLVPAAVQTPVALLWSIGARTVLETKRRLEIRRAFSLYLSPHMADEIAEQRFDLKPGGRLVEATLMFTDLKDFTALSEQLGDPRRISDVLTAYFTRTTQHVFDHRGTIIKYIGDAVFATWGAPLEDPDHAYHAVLAAWGMHQASQADVHGHRLVTRIGVNTGTVLAGNLGSAFRFDYTLIGDAANLASRLEGLNKYLGTGVLITAETNRALSERMAVRWMGLFRVVGREEPVSVYEVLGPEPGDEVLAQAAEFARGLESFQAGDFAGARRQMEATRASVGGHDGPSEFYLKTIAELERNGVDATWDGVVNFTAK